ncbi:MAG TPA: hypothetical protein PKL56_16090 [Cyclobacteriaceae bacterium]|nr:hypothetical protein [Cyclobacteriaceae bacterium]HMX88057.1 hypothetical protein [Saprospiraceae bacterium]HMX00890.1 hypothetical protein [Cyclobacteriaceae bacterium]HMY93694.1 hypothetical protein [Cyclobacteriaceae bacterium]HNA12872.1 hypothetical protein [Cyclobacteriaceae bacterium]
MKKKENAKGLSNAFNEFEKIDLTGKELDNELVELGIDPTDLVKKVREKIEKLNSTIAVSSLNQETKEEFNPFLLAASKKRKEKGPKKARKRD